ncbi:tyrosine-type recombinase/integrase [Methanobacterium bryantii]|uniref:Integrase n=2 Tax=Methanobacterium TaxID=2160 RepID=A0A2A2H3M7_METBR|nr:site-specific integrase [Methanobacterium bryantii]OEC86753.1 hypothetical protein A9507_09905 [Methanobacterium sp. A39]PAV04031.1 hypothetical protein ASJ80_03180 [Methanobacterium bryantii]
MSNKKVMPVEDESLFIEFCDNRGLSKGSILAYRTSLQKYSDFTNMSLEELIQQAEDEEEEQIRMKRRKIRSYLMDFRKYLNEQKFASNYVSQVISQVRTFYSEYEVELPKKFRRQSRRDKVQETFEDIPTMDDVKKSLDYSSPTYRAITLLCVSSGMSRAEVCSLTFKDFYKAVGLREDLMKTIPDLIEKIKEIDDLIPMWKIHRIKTGKAYFTFNSPETTDAILDYLDQHYRDYAWQPKPEDQLFRQYNKPITPDSVTVQYQRINKRAGFPKINGRVHIRPHSLRKVFATTLEKNRMPHLMSRWMLGHTIEGTTNAYFKADPESIKEEYIEIVDKLSTSKVKVKIIRTGYDEVQSKLEDMRLRQTLYERQMRALKEDKELKSND